MRVNLSLERLAMLAVTAIVVATVSSCGDDDAGSATSGRASTATSSSSPSLLVPTENEAESVDCELAATKWYDRMSQHALSAISATAVIPSTEDLDDLDDLTSEIKVLCSREISSRVLEANYGMALANANLQICVNAGECSVATAKKVHKSTKRIGTLIGEVKGFF